MIDGLLGVYSVADRFRTSHLMLLNRDSLAALHILDIDGVTVGEVVCFAATCPNIQKLEMGRIDRRGAASGALHTIAVQGEGGGGGLARAGVEGQGIVGSRA